MANDNEKWKNWHFRPLSIRDMRNFDSQHSPYFRYISDQTKPDPYFSINGKNTNLKEDNGDFFPALNYDVKELTIEDKLRLYRKARRDYRVATGAMDASEDVFMEPDYDERREYYQKKWLEVWSKPLFLGTTSRCYTSPLLSSDVSHVLSSPRSARLAPPKTAWSGSIGWQTDRWHEHFTPGGAYKKRLTELVQRSEDKWTHRYQGAWYPPPLQ